MVEDGVCVSKGDLYDDGNTVARDYVYSGGITIDRYRTTGFFILEGRSVVIRSHM